MTDELKPVRCGCGGEPYLKYDDGAYSVMCTKCGIETKGYCDHFDNFRSAKEYATKAWNRAMGVDRKLDEWCTDCKEYDHKKHCCPRWNRVIKNVVDEVREKYDERVAKVEYRETKMGFTYRCCNCDNRIDNSCVKYCPHCGARLEWE